MLKKFSLSLTSSWLASPLGILIAQFFGVANSQEIILILLATGAATPFQLIMNECLAAAVAGRKATPSWFQLVAITIIQIGACAWGIYAVDSYSFDGQLKWLVVFALAANTLNSYVVAVVFYGLVMRNGISTQNSAFVGAIPGLASVILYIFYCVCSYVWPFGKPLIAVAICCLPAIVQLVYVVWIRRADIVTLPQKEQFLPVVASPRLFLALFALAVLAILSTDLRGQMAKISESFTALILVMLNAILSLTNMLTRVLFLLNSSLNMQRITAFVGLSGFLLATVAYFFQWQSMLLIFFIASQAAIAWTITFSRSISITSKKIRMPLLFK